MKTYVKHSHAKPLSKVYYSTSDLLTRRTVQETIDDDDNDDDDEEQQRQSYFLSSFNKPYLQHKHVGKYGIKPIDSRKIKRNLSKVIHLFSIDKFRNDR